MPVTADFTFHFHNGLIFFKEVQTEKTSSYNPIKAIYQLLALRVGSAKAILATARMMVEVLYHISLTETILYPPPIT
jgi:stage III sporulation protein SpoIIIAA